MAASQERGLDRELAWSVKWGFLGLAFIGAFVAPALVVPSLIAAGIGYVYDSSRNSS